MRRPSLDRIPATTLMIVARRRGGHRRRRPARPADLRRGDRDPARRASGSSSSAPIVTAPAPDRRSHGADRHAPPARQRRGSLPFASAELGRRQCPGSRGLLADGRRHPRGGLRRQDASTTSRATPERFRHLGYWSDGRRVTPADRRHGPQRHPPRHPGQRPEDLPLVLIPEAQSRPGLGPIPLIRPGPHTEWADRVAPTVGGFEGEPPIPECIRCRQA